MTREQAKQNLITIGIEAPTDEQVSSYLNQVGGETNREKKRAEQYKADAQKVSELQAQLDELNNANLSDLEKLNKALEDEKAKTLKLESDYKTMQIRNSLAEQGVIGEQADKLIESIASGSFDASLLGQIISDREKSAVAKHEEQLLDNTPNPNGGSGDNNDATPADVANVQTISFGTVNEKAQANIDFYK